MAEGWITFAYVATYGFIVGYAAFLVARWRRLGR